MGALVHGRGNRLNAVCLIRAQPHYRREAFLTGLQRAGYRVMLAVEAVKVRSGDVLVIWNRTGVQEIQADQWEEKGGTVLVAENGYIGADRNGVQLYALSVRGHNGSGIWPYAGPERWQQLGIEVRPWRREGDFLVVRAQRGIGSRTMASPPNWPAVTTRYLASVSPRRVIVQAHPGKPACDPVVAFNIRESLRGAHAMVIWSSAAGVRALVEGVPVFYDAPKWICWQAALPLREAGNLEHPKMNDHDRMSALHCMAWAQWRIAEIETGEPFVMLRECALSWT
jgi:hypothetical protein